MKRNVIAMILVLLLTASLFTGCGAPAEEVVSGSKIKPLSVDLSHPAEIGLSAFDNSLIEFLKQTGRTNQSFVVSPLSFRAALALAAVGANGTSREELLAAMGFSSIEEMEDWYRKVVSDVNAFAAYNGAQSENVYRLINSIWENQGLPGEFLEEYRKLVAERYSSEAFSASADEMTNAINEWVKEQTNGLIPRIVDNASISPAVLVNAIYLKSTWIDEFHESLQTEFTTWEGKTVTKPFMERTGKYDYYEDDACQIVVIPLQGGVSMVLVLGDDTGFSAKLAAAESRSVRVVAPKFDVETAFENDELCSFLATYGCEKIFTGEADFSAMFTDPICIDSIVQRAKVKVDENGLEAAAATAIIMKNTAFLPELEEPAVFCADRPFSFYVLCGDENPNVLFWGQIMD